MKKNKIKKLSEGENFISDYLRSEKIKFDTQVRIYDLKNDTKKYRDADFYLPNLKVYIEFNGMWNVSKEDRERYRLKKKVYFTNNIPCIYLYPENLGIIDYCFSKRLVDVLKKDNLKKELFKYRFNRLKEDRGDLFFWVIATTLILIFSDYTFSENKSIFLFFISVLIYQISRLYNGYIKFFRNTNYYSFIKE